MQGIVDSLRRHGSLLLMALLLSAPALALQSTGSGMRSWLMQAVAFTLLVALVARVNWSPAGLKRFAATGPNVAVLAFVAWCALSTIVAAPAGRGQEFAMAELMRLGAGAVIYFAVLYRFGSRERLNLLSYMILGGGMLAALSGALSFLQTRDATGAFGNHQLLAGFLVMLLPVAFAFAVQGPLDRRRVMAIVAVAMIAGAMILTKNRSSWLGSMVGLAVIGGLALFDPRLRVAGKSRKPLAVYAAVVAASAALFFAFSGTSGVTSKRVLSLTVLSSDSSVSERQDLLSVAGQMLRQSPIFGQGLGSFARLAGKYDAKFPSTAEVDRNGATMTSMLHNEPVQIAAESGFVGLAIYLAILGGFFIRGVRSLGRIDSESRRWFLLGTLGAVAAQVVDSLGNPAWRFGDVSPLFWMMLGLGMAVSRTHGERAAAGETIRVTPRTSAAQLGRFGWAGASVALGVLLAASSFASNVSTQVVIQRYVVGGLTANPNQIHFGRLRVRDQQQITRTLILNNTGTSPLNIAIVVVNLQQGSSFRLARGVRAFFDLQPGNSRRIDLTALSGGNANGFVRVFFGPPSPLTIPLTLDLLRSVR